MSPKPSPHQEIMIAPAYNAAPLDSAAFKRSKRLSRKALGLGSLTLLFSGLSGCSSVSGTPNLALVRIIDAAADTSGIDVYQGAGILAYDLGLGTITSYVPTSPGTYALNSDLAGTKQLLATAYGTFQLGGQYTVIVGDDSTALQETILKDQTIPAPAGEVSIRFVDQSTRTGAVDLYLIPMGSNITQVKPALTGVAFGTNTGYIDVPSGTYTLSAVPSGSVPTTATTTSFTSASTYYPSGSARTIVLIDQKLITTPGLQVVVADDYDYVGTPN